MTELVSMVETIVVGAFVLPFVVSVLLGLVYWLSS